MKITVVSKNPPGGRCTLYLRYAETIAAERSAVETIYAQSGDPVPPPALLLNGRAVVPADGLLLEPVEVQAAALAAGFDGDPRALLAALDAVQEELMLAWATGAE